MQSGIRDISTGFVLIVLSIFGYLIANGFSSGEESASYGPGFFPKLILILLTILSLGLLIKGIVSVKTEKHKIQLDIKKITRVVTYIVLLILYINLFFMTGFIISTILFLIVGQFLFGMRNWLKIIAIAIFTAFILYYFFTGLFNIPLP